MLRDDEGGSHESEESDSGFCSEGSVVLSSSLPDRLPSFGGVDRFGKSEHQRRRDKKKKKKRKKKNKRRSAPSSFLDAEEDLANFEKREVGLRKIYAANWLDDGSTEGHVVVFDKHGRFEGKLNEDFEFQGPGVRMFFNGDWYSGAYDKGKRSGEGTYVFANGDRFDGTFVENKMQVGSFRWIEGDFYSGSFVNQAPHGNGKKCMTDGSVYEGGWRDGKAHGWGTKTFSNGDIHEGCYAENNRQGYGFYKFANGDVFEGFFENGRACGRGRQLSFDGKVYEGDFLNGRAHGLGYRWQMFGDRQELGDFESGKMHGFGMIDSPQCSYIGGFEKNELQGNGELVYFETGILPKKFVGMWQNNLPHGIGRFEDGARHVEGTWVEGRLQGVSIVPFVLQNMISDFPN